MSEVFGKQNAQAEDKREEEENNDDKRKGKEGIEVQNQS